MSHEQTAAGSTVGANNRRGGTPRRRVHTHGAGAPASAWPASHIRGALATIYGGGSKARNEDGTPRKRFRSLQHEIMATLDGEQERERLQELHEWHSQASSWDSAHDESLVQYRDQIIKHRDLAHQLKREALQQIRSRMSIKSREIDEEAEQAYKELLLAYKMTSFEDRLHEYTVTERNLEDARQKITGFPQRQVPPSAERLPEILPEVLDRFYGWRKPHVVEEMKSLNLFDIDTLGDPHAGVGEDHDKLSVNQEGSRPTTSGSKGHAFPLPPTRASHSGSHAASHTPSERPSTRDQAKRATLSSRPSTGDAFMLRECASPVGSSQSPASPRNSSISPTNAGAALSHRQYAAKRERERLVKAAKIAATPRHEQGSLMEMLHRTPAPPSFKPLHLRERDNAGAEPHKGGAQLETPRRDGSKTSRPVGLLLPPTPRRCANTTTPRHAGSSAVTPRQPATTPRRPATGETERWRGPAWTSTGGGGGWFGATSTGTLRTGRPSLALEQRPITSGLSDGVSQARSWQSAGGEQAGRMP